MPLGEREPQRLVGLWRSYRDHQGHLRDLAPSLAFAVLGQARATGELSPETEGRAVGGLLTYWALRSTLHVPERPQIPDRPATLSQPRPLQHQPA